MNPDTTFQICNSLVLPAWLLLALAPKWKWTNRIVLSGIVLVLAIVYVIGTIQTIQSAGLDFASFGSLKGVMTLFTDPVNVLIGWVHYLAFDLVVGWLVVQNAIRHEINHFLVIPCLLFTFMLGPSGFLLYWIIRTIKTGQFFPVQTVTT